MLGFYQSNLWQTYGAAESQKGVENKKVQDKLNDAELEEQNAEDDDDVSYLELKDDAPQKPLMLRLEETSTQSKIAALKYFQIQLYFTSADVEKNYWVNRLMQLVIPQQLMLLKVYKNYLSTFALSLAFQLHDVFTFEAYIDDFNDKYGDAAGASAELTEVMAEEQVYQKWYALSMIKMQLFYLHLYEQSIMTSAARQSMMQMASRGYNSFVELESSLKAEPENPQVDPAQAMASQYAYFSYYSQLLRFFAITSEVSLAQTGLMCSNFKRQAFDLLHDGDDSNDSDGEKYAKQAQQLESVYLPFSYSRWGQISSSRFYMEYFALMMDMNMPALLPGRAAERAETSIESMNLVQTAQEPAKQ